MPWNPNTEEIEGIIDANIKSSPPNPPMVNTSFTMRDSLKAFWGVIAEQIGATVDDMDDLIADTSEKISQIHEEFALSDGLGTYNATTGVATLKEAGTTFTPVPVASQAIGKYFDVVVAGTQNITGTSVAMEVGGVIISRGTKWDYIPPKDSAYQDLNRSKIIDSGIMTGAVIPELQYQHSRGEAEMLGDASYNGPKGFIIYEQMTAAVAFNRVRVPVRVNVAEAVTIRAYKASSYVKNPVLMTLLEEVVAASGSFNTLSTAFHTVDFASIHRVKPGEYLYIAVHYEAATASNLYLRRWTTDSVGAPFRHKFLYTSGADWWNIDWTESAVISGYAQTSFDLYQINLPASLKILKDDFEGIKPSSNAMHGGRLPEYQYIHERGQAEIIGNATYGPFSSLKGLGLYEFLTKPASFNRITLRMHMASAGDLTAKVFKSKALTPNVNLMTEIASVSIASGNFNSDPFANAIIDLGSYVHIDENTYVYIMLYAADISKIGLNYWTALYGSGTERHYFMHLSNSNGGFATPWVASWDTSVTGYYGTPFFLTDSLENSSVKKLSSGKIQNSFIPTTQYEHVRGEAEMLGNQSLSSASYYGLAMFQQVTDDLVFNKIEFPICALSDLGSINVRIYRSNGSSGVGAQVTLLHSQDIASRDFNRFSNKLQSIILDNPVSVSKNQFIHVYAYATNVSNLSIRYFDTISASPDRTRFKYKDNQTNPWGASWSATSSTYYSASFRLSIVDAPSEKRVLALEYRIPRLVLPSKIYAIVGTELSVYYDAIIYDRRQDYVVTITCAKGVQKTRCWRITPVLGDVGTHSLVCTIYDQKHNEVFKKTISLVIVNSTNPATAKYYLQCGDSITEATGSRTALTDRMSTLSTGTAPVSTGSRGAGAFGKHEGRGGWKWIDFAGDGMSAAQAPLGNPFWNSGALDFANYRTANSIPNTFSLVSLQLGVNDSRTGVYLNDTAIQLFITQAKAIITAIFVDSPSAKVIIQLPTTCRNTPISSAMEIYTTNIWRLRELILESFDNFVYHANVYVGQAGICVDRFYAYQISSSVVGSRYTETEINSVDDVHLRAEGYQQMGDALFPQFIALMQ